MLLRGLCINGYLAVGVIIGFIFGMLQAPVVAMLD